jgi:hypothetical protein
MTPIVLLAVRFVIKNVITNANVMVKLQHLFQKASTQKYLRITQRKDSQQITHVFCSFSPMFGIAISRINNTTGSKIPPPVAIHRFLISSC